jgi:hypothetical protein
MSTPKRLPAVYVNFCSLKIRNRIRIQSLMSGSVSAALTEDVILKLVLFTVILNNICLWLPSSETLSVCVYRNLKHYLPVLPVTWNTICLYLP